MESLDLYVHLFSRSITSVLIFHLIYIIKKNSNLLPIITKHWYILALGQISFLFFPFLKNYLFDFPILFVFKFFLGSFCFFLWLTSRVFLNPNFVPKLYDYVWLLISEIFVLAVTRIDGVSYLINGTTVSKSIAFSFFIISIMIQFVLSFIAIKNTYQSIKKESDSSILFIKQYFLVSASFTVFFILFAIVLNPSEHSQVRLWFVSMFQLSIVSIAYIFLLPKLKNENERILNTIKEIIEKEKLIFEETCSLKEFSNFSEIPEYKLRKIIKDDLKFKNFNHFLNFHRIEKATEILMSSDYANIPIARIASMVGFNSIATFNRAFKDIKNIKPTQLRSKKDRL